MQVTRTPQKPQQRAGPVRLVIGWVLLAMAVVVTALCGYQVYDYAAGEYIGADAAARVFILLVSGVFALFSWSVGLLLVLKQEGRSRRWIRAALVAVLVLVAVGVLVLMALAKG